MAMSMQEVAHLQEQKRIDSSRISKQINKLKKKNEELGFDNADLQHKIQVLEKKKGKNEKQINKHTEKIDSLEEALKRINK